MSDPTIETATHKQAAITTFIQKSPLPAESHAKEFFKAVGHTFTGIAVVALGVFAKGSAPWLVWVALCVGGFWIIAPRTIKGAFQFILGAIKDAIAEKKENDGA